jgi:hypothetical protein
MSSKEVYNVGTTVYYAGDDANEGAYGRVTDHIDDYLGELQMEITLADGRVIYNVTPQDFEADVIAGNWKSAEFYLVDAGEAGVTPWFGLIGQIGEDDGYSEDNTTLQYMI